MLLNSAITQEPKKKKLFCLSSAPGKVWFEALFL